MAGSIKRALTITLLASFFACGGNGSPLAPLSGGTNSASSAPKDWSALGGNTVASGSTKSAVSHSDYLQGSHSTYTCSNCHDLTVTDPATQQTSFVPRDQICSYCHPFSKYSSLAVNVDHVALNAGTHCNACHFSVGGVTGSAIGGWRWSSVTGPKTRAPHANWHSDVQGVCQDCHTPANEPIPATHPAVTSTTACETCHKYNNGSWKGAKGHASVTSGCAATGCHATHSHTTVSSKTIAGGGSFASYGCEKCHQASVNGGFKDWTGAAHFIVSQGCANCHAYHNPGKACESCHSAAIFSGYTSWKG